MTFMDTPYGLSPYVSGTRCRKEGSTNIDATLIDLQQLTTATVEMASISTVGPVTTCSPPHLTRIKLSLIAMLFKSGYYLTIKTYNTMLQLLDSKYLICPCKLNVLA
eukprot:1188259-Prorocentrum_minimum.AAC.2